MSKRKTPDKGLNGPKPKRQKLSNDVNTKNDNAQIIGTSSICNMKNDQQQIPSFIAHCYGNNNPLSSSLIQIKHHNVPLSNDVNHASVSASASAMRLYAQTDQRVKIYWTEDKQWYFGTIKDFKASTNKSKIVYDDGEYEWLDLTQSGDETVEFLYDPSTTAANTPDIQIGDNINSGNILSTFNHGYIANINELHTAIAFETKYIQQVINKYPSRLHSLDIFKLLTQCRFDSSKQINHALTNGHHTNKTPPWISIGCTSELDAVTKSDSESHINLIHSNRDHHGKSSSKSAHYSKKSSNGKASHVYNQNVGQNNNNITKKCNNKSILDLRAIYPLQKIRKQNHEKGRKIIIIGAGISGLSAARECMNFGYDVTVLEVEILYIHPCTMHFQIQRREIEQGAEY